MVRVSLLAPGALRAGGPLKRHVDTPCLRRDGQKGIMSNGAVELIGASQSLNAAAVESNAASEPIALVAQSVFL